MLVCIGAALFILIPQQAGMAGSEIILVSNEAESL
ncbi:MULTISPECIES: hypothetical protein [unclassified Halomonas]